MDEELKKLIDEYENELGWKYSGTLAERLRSIVERHKRNAVEIQTKNRQLLEDFRVWLKSLAVIVEMIAESGTHRIKSILCEGLLGLCNKYIYQIADTETDFIFRNGFIGLDWRYSDIPYKKVIEKYYEQNEKIAELEKELKELKGEPKNSA